MLRGDLNKYTMLNKTSVHPLYLLNNTISSSSYNWNVCKIHHPEQTTGVWNRSEPQPMQLPSPLQLESFKGLGRNAQDLHKIITSAAKNIFPSLHFSLPNVLGLGDISVDTMQLSVSMNSYPVVSLKMIKQQQQQL